MKLTDLKPWQRLKELAGVSRRRREEDLERELQAHLDLEAEEAELRGLPPREARYAAHRAFGNAALVKEDVRPVEFAKDNSPLAIPVGRHSLMGGRVFISCGQATAEERQAAASVRDWFRGRGFDSYVAIETQSIQDVNSGIIGELKRADYYVFIDFAREQLVGEKVSRGSLFTNQELAIAYVLGFEDVIFLQQEGVELEGLLKYMVANPKKFTGSSELPVLLGRLVTERRWEPTHSRHLVVTNLHWFGPGESTTIGDDAGNHWHAKPLNVDIENRRGDIGAEKMKLRLAFVSSENGERLPSVDRSPLKATDRSGFEHDIWPKSHETFDLLFIDTRAPHRIYLYSELDVRPRPPLLEQLGIYRLDFEGWALGFPLLRFSVVLKTTGDSRTTTAELDPRHWE